jgi:hypothetical protein
MTVPAAAVASSDSSSATSLENDVGAMFGDLPSSSDEESPESGTTSAAGTTPAEPTPETATEPSATTEPAGATATPLPSDGTTPAAAPVLPAEDDPFKDTTPATYVVQGKSIPVEDIRVFKEGGAVIRPEALPNILSKLADRDNLSEQNRAQYDQVKDFERLSEWKQTGEDGKEQILQGRDGLIGMRTDFDSLKASFDTFIEVLKPQADGSYPLLEALVSVDDKGRIVANPGFVNQLLERANNAEFRAKVNVRERVAQISRPQTQTSGRSAETATQLDPVALRAEAPGVLQLIAQQEGVDTKLLTADDQKFLADQFPRFVRPITEEERRDPNNRSQTHITDGAFTQLVTRQVALRKEIAATSQATEKATKEGQARMLQAARGVKPSRPEATPPVVPTPPSEDRAASEGELFDSSLRSASRALRAR